jgi:hypothetical protein
MASLRRQRERAKVIAALTGRQRRRARILARVRHLVCAPDGSWTGQHEMSAYERRNRDLPKDGPPIIVERWP